MITPEVAMICLTVIEIATLVTLSVLYLKREDNFYSFTMARESQNRTEKSEALDRWNAERKDLLNRVMARSLIEYETGTAMERGTPGVSRRVVKDSDEAKYERGEEVSAR